MTTNPLRDTTISQAPPSPAGAPLFVRDSPRVAVELAGLSQAGKGRSNNEDNYAVIRRTRSQEVLLTSQSASSFPSATDYAHVLMMADGMGGAAFGELASSLAIRSIWSLGEQCTSWIMKVSEFDAQLIKERVEAYTKELQRVLRDAMVARPQAAGMGTTLTTVCVMGWDAIVVQIGDSRAYLHRDGRLRRLTRDETIGEELAQVGMGDEVSRAFHHMLTSCLGGDSKSARPDIDHVRLAAGDVLLLASDGLTDKLRDDAIAGRLGERADLKSICQNLVDDAVSHGAKDDVSVVLARFSDAGDD